MVGGTEAGGGKLVNLIYKSKEAHLKAAGIIKIDNQVPLVDFHLLRHAF